jgi:soluble lytic murein transglycosylase
VTNPITLARAFYWQGRATEALGREEDARSFYRQAAYYPTAYYGQLARAKLGLNEVTLRLPPEPAPEHRTLEISRVFEILYAIDERDLVAAMAADLGENATDTAALVGLAGIAARHHDARATLLIGKAALRRGLPFERYAFPDFGVSEYQHIRAWSRAPMPSASCRSRPRRAAILPSALMSLSISAGLAKTSLTMPSSVPQSWATTSRLGAAPTFSPLLPAMRGRGGPRSGSSNTAIHAIPRSIRIDWIERIPISETRNYVQRVLENMQVYRALLENNPKLPIEADLRRGG